MRKLKHRLNRLRLRVLSARAAAPPRPVYRGRLDGNKLVAITFDDGPSPVNTPAVLALLETYGARATFFVVGQEVERHPALAGRIIDGGHELANHTWSHAHPRTLGEQDLRVELVRASSSIEAATDQKPRLARPPYGKARARFARTAAELDLVTLMWSIDSGDTSGFSAVQIVRHVRRAARPGAIVLFHDGGADRRLETLAAVEGLLTDLRAMGYRFVTASSLLAAPGPPKG
jgi:peptidoglycan/xylan/chitin deacetylase (PgdA/CDA1 family)